MVDQNVSRQAQIVYLSHGGGPLPILGDPGHADMLRFMQNLPARLSRPKVILVVSAHWEAPQPQLFSAPDVPLFYDYTGFPAAAYDITYPAPASRAWVDKISAALTGAGFSPTVHPHRGLDHGVFIPLKMMYPAADIPVVQLSLISGLDPAAHLALGKALRGSLAENLLVVASGFSFHNLDAFFAPAAENRDPANEAFQDWLIETVTGGMPQDVREQRLLQWESAPSARYCHPRAEHLLPLHVCAGMAGRAGEKVFDDRIMGKRSTAFLW